ncbi:response regulator [Pleurocapsales cyanobacterium LEGE 06147]|nr:response regulator [Pleurocapsales cyanobacterium LEGE 06147]
MQSSQYDSGQLNSLLESLQKDKFSGVLHLTIRIASRSHQRSCVLIWRSGEIVYGGLKVLSNKEFADMLGQKFQPGWINAAIEATSKRLNNPTSVREMAELLVRLKLFEWKTIESFIQAKVICLLEQFIPYSGQARWESGVEFDLCYGEDCHGLDWTQLKSDLVKRQQEWTNLSPLIPSMEIVPHLPEGTLAKITDLKVRQHLKRWVDGKRSLLDIAEQMDRDPLRVGQSYFNWAQLGWISFHSSNDRTISTATESAAAAIATSKPEEELPMILSVDDSPIVQTAIKRALSDRYNVILTDKAMDALNLLNQKPIKLLLLDLTMPDVDGLEICRTIRSISKFRDLPIIMLTARDGLIDKMKGHIAGTTKYLTKPFEPEQLLEIVNKYVLSGNT